MVTIKRRNYGKNHGYTINGAKAFGVTTALSKGLPKPALTYWSARCVAEKAVEIAADLPEMIRSLGTAGVVSALKAAPWQQRDEAAARGTDVHNLAELLIHGEDVAVPEHLAGHVESCVRFMDDWKVKPLLVERPVGSYAWGYAGTFDLIGEVPDGRRILFDYKTSKSGIFPETALQLAAYRHADAYVADDEQATEIPMREIGITESKAVWIRADGYDVIPLQTDDLVFKAFLHVLSVARMTEHMDTWRGEAEMPR